MVKCVFNRKNIEYLFLTIFLIVITSILMNSSFYDIIITFDKKIISSVSYIVNTYYTNFFSILTNFGDWYIPIVIIVCILLFTIKGIFVFSFPTKTIKASLAC